jgi:hypothetical protein
VPQLAGTIHLGVEFRKPIPVGALCKRILLVPYQRAALEAVESFQDVLRPADRLAELAVADNVDAGFGLFADDCGYAVLQYLVVGCLVDSLAAVLGSQDVL